MVTSATRRRTGDLPLDLTSFVGRRDATAHLKRALSTSRLVTLTGVGGVGKSRLALHTAQELRRAFADGVWLVELAKLHDESLVGNAVVTALDLADTSVREPGAVLVDYLADKQLLLVLDNCEHLLDACARLVDRLLRAAPGLRVLATSREPLRIDGEQVWPVEPLSVPGVDAWLGGGSARSYEALALFADRAAAATPEFELNHDNERAVARLCQRLDGLPLAIELAAVRLRALSVEQILTRLEDRFRLLTAGNRSVLAHHETLRAAVDWSYDLCSELERTLWARLSIFAGEFDLEAAENVCAGDGLTSQDVLEGMAGLVEKSILMRGEVRTRSGYRMLETIRQYGRERLAERGEESVLRRRHRDNYLRLAQEAESVWFGPNQAAWLNRFRADQADLWAALEFSLTQPDQGHTGLRMVGALYWYWMVRALRDGRYWLDRALAADTQPSRERAKALWVDGWVAVSQGEPSYHVPLLEESRSLAERLGDEKALASALQIMGVSAWLRSKLPEAVAFLEQALDQHQAAGAPDSAVAMAQHHLAVATALLGDGDRAVALGEECLALCQAHDECWTRSWGLWSLVLGRWRQGDLRQASMHAKECLRLKRSLNDQLGIPFCVEFLAWGAMAEDDAERAAVLLGTSKTMWEPIGGRGFFASDIPVDSVDQCRTWALEALGEQAFEEAYQRGRHFTFDAAVAYALGEESKTPSAAAARVEQDVLTKREREVAELVARGMSNKQIAGNLVVAQRTAEGHIEHILTKLGFTSRTQIAAWIAEQRDT